MTQTNLPERSSIPVLQPPAGKPSTKPAMSRSPISKDSIADRIRQELVDRVLDGRIAAGARLVEMEVAREFQTSQAPVREAFRQLASQGVVILEPFKATLVRELTLDDVQRVYAIRAAIEPLAAAGAAPRLKGNVGQLRKLLTEMLKACRQKDVLAYGLKHIAFHRSIITLCGDPILLRMWDSLAFEIRVSVRLAGEYLKYNEIQEAYGELIEALDSGDAARVADLLGNRGPAFVQAA